MAYYVTNNKARLIMGFVPGVTVIANDRYEELNGKGDELKTPQKFFREQVAIKNLVVVKSETEKAASGDSLELIASMNAPEAVEFCEKCGDARILKRIKENDKRKTVSKAASDRLLEISPRDAE